MRKVSTWYRHDLEHSNLKPTLHWSSLIIFNQKFKSRLYHNCSKPECNQSLTFVSWRHWRCKSSPALFFFKHLGGIVSCAQITQTIWGSPTFACWNSTSKSCNASQPNREITVLFSEGGGRAVEGSKLVEARNGLDPMTGKGQCRNGLERLERGCFFFAKETSLPFRCKIGIFSRKRPDEKRVNLPLQEASKQPGDPNSSRTSCCCLT